MSQQPETRFKNKVRRDLEELERTWICKIQQVAKRGDPDFILCVNGQFVALELKKDGKEKPDPLQYHKLEKIIIAGGLAYVAHPQNWKKIYETLKRFSSILKPLDGEKKWKQRRA